MQIRTLLQGVRKARGLGAAELAKSVGVSRQTIYSIEDGSFVPNTTIALRLAQVLEVKVEQIFALDQPGEIESLEADFLAHKSAKAKKGQLVRLCRVNDRLIAAPIPSFPAFLPPADGVIQSSEGDRIVVKPAADVTQTGNSLLLAGCDPALSLLTGALEHSGIEIISVSCSSRCALEWLSQGRVHAGGSHLLDASTGDYNVPVVKRLFPQGGVRIVTFAVWEQGLLVAHGNPKGIRGIADIANQHAAVINREKGSGSRDLLDKGLRKAGIDPQSAAGYENLANGHLAAAYAVATGTADCCIATRSAALRFGLDFLPLAVERFDLTFAESTLALPAAKALLDLLNRQSFKRKLEAIAGYDTKHTGELLDSR